MLPTNTTLNDVQMYAVSNFVSHTVQNSGTISENIILHRLGKKIMLHKMETNHANKDIPLVIINEQGWLEFLPPSKTIVQLSK